MRYAIIDNGKVVNVVEADEDFEGGIRSDEANIDDNYDGITFTTPEKPAPLEIVITEMDCSDTAAIIADGSIICQTGSLFSFKAEIRKQGVKQPITDFFRMPLVASDGRVRMVLARFVDGAAEIRTQLNESGFWSVTGSEINKGLPEGQRFSFGGLTIDTYL